MALMLLHLHYSRPKTQKPKEAERHSIQRPIPWAEPSTALSCQAYGRRKFTVIMV